MTNANPHGINPGVLLVELIMSADRIITAAEAGKARSGEWNPATIVGHLTQVDEQVWMARIITILDPTYSERYPDGASFPWWEPDPVATEKKYAELAPTSVAADFLAMRTSLLMLLKGLPGDVWQRTWPVSYTHLTLPTTSRV